MRNGKQRTLGIDPGTKNYALVGLNSNGKVVMALLLKNTIWSLSREHKALRAAYRAEILALLTKFKPSEIIYEQFVVRSFGTTLTQMVNMMNGALGVYADIYGFDEETITSTTWKNAIKRIGDLQGLYDYANSLEIEQANGRKKARGIPPHLVDALCMATWKRNGNKFLNVDRKRIARNIRRIQKVLLHA